MTYILDRILVNFWVKPGHPIEYRYNKARQAGIAVTSLTQVLEAREALSAFEQEHIGEILQCHVGAEIDTEGPLDRGAKTIRTCELGSQKIFGIMRSHRKC